VGFVSAVTMTSVIGAFTSACFPEYEYGVMYYNMVIKNVGIASGKVLHSVCSGWVFVDV
jgi:hypothetical protein